MPLPRSLDEIQDEFRVYDELSDDPKADRNSLVIDLGRALELMPEALKTDETQVPGCASKVWVYPVPGSSTDQLRFLADSNSGLAALPTTGRFELPSELYRGRRAGTKAAADSREHTVIGGAASGLAAEGI